MASVRADTMKREAKSRLIPILDDMDLSWYPAEIQYAAQLYREGKSILDMARILRPLDQSENAEDEVALLIVHMARQGLIKGRDSGCMGMN